jgi:zinc transport system permease protein
LIEPFLLRALAAGIGLAIIAAPLGAILVWNRMAYFGESVAQASLVGVALGLLLGANLTASVIITTLAVAGLLIILSRQKVIPLDSILGLTHHGALALGVIATSVLAGPSVDLMGYLFGDVFAISNEDLIWVFGGGAIVLGVLAWLWQPLLRLAVHEELAAAEGVSRDQTRGAFIVVLALTIAVAMKIVGILLAIAFLIVPVVAARPFASTPERLVVLAACAGILSVIGGLALSSNIDAPGGPSIVLIMSLIAAISLAISARRLQG